jgi:hypothetical protein
MTSNKKLNLLRILKYTVPTLLFLGCFLTGILNLGVIMLTIATYVGLSKLENIQQGN